MLLGVQGRRNSAGCSLGTGHQGDEQDYGRDQVDAGQARAGHTDS